MQLKSDIKQGDSNVLVSAGVDRDMTDASSTISYQQLVISYSLLMLSVLLDLSGYASAPRQAVQPRIYHF